jgi:hypothetical protein
MKNQKYANMKLGNTPYRVRSYGCLLLSISSLLDRDPKEINALFTRNNIYNANGEIDCAQAAKVLGLNYKKLPPEEKPTIDCILETSYWAPNYKQHFAVMLKTGKIMDTLNGQIIENKYKNAIVSYRLFTKEVPA